MIQTIKPTKEQVRRFMERRTAEHTPPPDMEQIRRELWSGPEAIYGAGKVVPYPFERYGCHSVVSL